MDFYWKGAHARPFSNSHPLLSCPLSAGICNTLRTRIPVTTNCAALLLQCWHYQCMCTHVAPEKQCLMQNCLTLVTRLSMLSPNCISSFILNPPPSVNTIILVEKYSLAGLYLWSNSRLCHCCHVTVYSNINTVDFSGSILISCISIMNKHHPFDPQKAPVTRFEDPTRLDILTLCCRQEHVVARFISCCLHV